MDNQEQWKLLHQLRDEIEKIETVDEKGSALLRDLDEDIRLLLERSGENPVPFLPSIVQRLEGPLYHFEASHPKLTAVISRLMDSLSNSGI